MPEQGEPYVLRIIEYQIYFDCSELVDILLINECRNPINRFSPKKNPQQIRTFHEVYMCFVIMV
jgi:hypothetical protein